MTTHALASFSEDELNAELQRRRFIPKKVHHVWTCHCGVRFVGGSSDKTVHAEVGQVWCRPCYGGRPDFGGTHGPRAIPMAHITEEIQPTALR